MKILKLSQKNLKETAKKALIALKSGDVLMCPTDTVHGLLCDSTNKKAVEKIFKIKKREKTKPLALFVEDIAAAKKLAFISKKQKEFLKKVWPGKVTVILKRKDVLADREQFSASWQRTVLCNELLSGKNQTIGLRVPNYKLVNELLKKLKKPIAQTSANISGKPAATRIKEVLEQFKNQPTRPDLVVDAGNLPESKPSKVVDLTREKIKVLRY